MSLLERVSNAQQTYSTHDAPRHNEAHPNARTNDAALERFEELRSGVGTHLSSSDMGALITRNRSKHATRSPRSASACVKNDPGSRQRTENARSLSIAISIACSDLVHSRSS